MLDQVDPADLISQLPCRIELPEAWKEYFSVAGTLPPVFDDRRRYPRHHCRQQAALFLKNTYPWTKRTVLQHGVYVKDISQNGICFLHSEQIFPLETFELLLVNGRPRCWKAVRCRRLQARCYEVGASIGLRDGRVAPYSHRRSIVYAVAVDPNGQRNIGAD